MNKRTIKKTGLSALIILLALLCAGAVYAWFSEQGEIKIADTVSAPKTDPNPIKPSKVDPNAQESAAVQSLSSPVKPGDNAAVSVKTNPKSICTIKVTYGDIESKDSGLVPKHANDFGIVGWSWTVDGSAPKGTWPVEVTCALNEKSAFVRGDQAVAP
jgi:hypothetical protein